MRLSLIQRYVSVAFLLLLGSTLGLAQGFRVVKAEYGAGNSWTDVTDRVRGHVRGEGLDFRVDGEHLGDPLPGVSKTLRVRYVLSGEERTDNFEDLSYVRLGNPNAVAPPLATPVPAPAPTPAPTPAGVDRPRPTRPGMRPSFPSRMRLTITKAEYGEGQRWRDVTELLNQQVTNSGLQLLVNNTNMGGDPAPAVPKRLRVQYLWNGQAMTTEAAENRELVLPLNNSGGGVFGQPIAVFEVLEAFYQANGRRNDVSSVLRSAIRDGRISGLRVNNQTMGGDPVPGPRKELVVRYRNEGVEYESVTREEGVLNLPNRSDRVWNGPPASNGANDNGGSIFGPSPNQPIGNQPGINSQLEIVAARWGSGDRWLDVTSDVQSALRNGRLSIEARGQSFWGTDPAPGVQKVLQVRYRQNNGPVRETSTNQGRTLILP